MSEGINGLREMVLARNVELEKEAASLLAALSNSSGTNAAGLAHQYAQARYRQDETFNMLQMLEFCARN